VPEAPGMLNVCLTVDVDADANKPAPGRSESVSPHAPGGEALFEASWEGFSALLPIWKEHGVKCTLFFEGRAALAYAERGLRKEDLSGHEIACHSFAHDDFTGHCSGICLDRDECARNLEKSRSVIKQVTGSSTIGFRAPYTRTNAALIAALVDTGFLYDSSDTGKVSNSWQLQPLDYLLPDGRRLREFPLATMKDSRGKTMGSYLWPVFENRRPIEEYVSAVERLAQTYPGGLFLLGIHPWHMNVNENGKAFRDRQVNANLAAVSKLCDCLVGLNNVRFVTLAEALLRISPPGGERMVRSA